MESSDSEDEGDGAESLGGSQTDRLLREEDFFRFVNNLTVEDYKLMRDNNLLGIPGESTEEELLRRLQLLKEDAPQNTDENTGGGDSSDDVSSGDSLRDWLNSVTQTKNVTGEQRENQSWTEVNQTDPNSEDSKINSERNANHNTESPDRENGYAPSPRLHGTENTEDSQSQMDNLPCESIYTKPFRCEQSTNKSLVDVPPTRGQKRARSFRSPDHRRTRARTDGGGDSSDDVSSGDSLRDWLNSVTQTENVTGEQRENQSWTEVNQTDPNSEDSKINSERNANHNTESPDRENGYAPSPRLHGTENTEDSQSQMDNLPCESIYTKPFRCEQSTNESLVDVPPTRGQKRARSRSPDHRRTRARTDGGGDSSDDVSSSDSLINWLNSVTQTENVTGEQRENQSWTEVNQTDPNSEDSKINSERNVNYNTESPDRENEYAPSPRLHETENTEDSQSQLENSPSESIYTKPFRWEQSTNDSLVDIQPTRGQRSARSRSPDRRNTRARIRGRSIKDFLRDIEEGFPHGIRPWNYHDLRGNEIERYSTTQHQETPRQQVTKPELQNRGPSVTSEIGNVIQDEYSSDSDSIGDPWGSRLMNSAIFSDTEEGRVQSRETYEEDSIASRTWLTSNRPNNAETLESEKGGLSHMFSHSEQADRTAYDSTNRLSLHRLLSSSCSDTTSSAIPNTSEQTMTGFSDSSNRMGTTNRLSLHRFLCSCSDATSSAIQNTSEQTMTSISDSSNRMGATNTLSLHRFLCSCCSDATSSAIQNTSEQTMTGFSDSSNRMGTTNRLSLHRFLCSCCSDTTSSAIQNTSEQTMNSFCDSSNCMGTTSRLSLHRHVCSCCSDTTSSAIQNTSEQTMTGFSDSSNRMGTTSRLSLHRFLCHCCSDATSHAIHNTSEQTMTGFSHSSNCMGSNNSLSLHRHLCSCCSDATSSAIQNTSEQTMTDFSDSSNRMGTTSRLSLHRFLCHCCSDATSHAIHNTSEQTMTGFSHSSNRKGTTNRLSLHRFLCHCCSDATSSAIQNTSEQTMTGICDSSNRMGTTNRLSLHRFLCSCCSDTTSSAIQNTSEQTMTGFSDSSNRMGTTNRLSLHRLLCSCYSDTTSSVIQNTSEQTMTGFSDSSNLMGSTNRLSLHRLLSSCCSDTSSAIQNTSEQTTGFIHSSNHTDSDGNLEPNVSAPSPDIERTSSPNGRDGSGNSSSSDINAIPRFYFHPASPSLSRSSSNYAPSSSSTPISSSSSSDNISVISSQLFEGNDERSISGLSENTTGSRLISPVTFDDSDSWTSLNLDQFFLLEEDQHQSTGLTKAQIDNLAIRSFGENDALKSCSICLTEFTEGNKIRTLPCAHEYHVHCIDRWLSENTTCPICRREVVDPAERENSN
ncbi:dentin sialophosphoprotein-like isoform X2 [Talpa occidentalis]|uniref:dentin sialophosphoprotein-like isoform X2 n=1 Tax=Talpa occidentalis TaxID=50954 RepID=UPI0023F9EE2C|nr:dentin sialophosphoprotein-like isoform X2 [Talpa occidentalis]